MVRFDRWPGYVSGVLEAYAAQRGTSPEDALPMARSADLWALVDLADRAGDSPVADHAARLLRAVARSGDGSAWSD